MKKNAGKKIPDVPAPAPAARAIEPDSIPAAFLAINDKGELMIMNAQAEQLFGWSFREIQHRPVEEILAIDPLPVSLKLARPPGKERLRLKRRDGQSFTAEIISGTAFSLDDETCVPLIIRDIDETLLAEQQLVQAQKLEAIGHLTGGLAHDFNNLLGIIIGTLDLVLPGVSGKIEKELVGAALSAAHRGTDITKALLAVARRRALQPQLTDINELIGEMTPLLRQTAGKSIEISVSPNALEATCNIDPGGFNNALVNLVINARDALPNGGQIIVYAYTTELLPRSIASPLELQPGRYIVVGVDDNGTGMPPDVALKAFDPFFTTKERGRGTGLGLAMVYGFARQSGGTATIETAVGRGTSVQLLIPVASEAADRQQRKPRQAAVRALRILLIEEDPRLRDVATAWLKELGHEPVTAGNSDDALAILAETRFDLLLTDIRAPGSMDGLALAERCRRLYPETRILFATGYADTQSAAMRSGSAVVGKPYTKTTLADGINGLYAAAAAGSPRAKRGRQKQQK